MRNVNRTSTGLYVPDTTKDIVDLFPEVSGVEGACTWVERSYFEILEDPKIKRIKSQFYIGKDLMAEFQKRILNVGSDMFFPVSFFVKNPTESKEFQITSHGIGLINYIIPVAGTFLICQSSGIPFVYNAVRQFSHCPNELSKVYYETLTRNLNSLYGIIN